MNNTAQGMRRIRDAVPELAELCERKKGQSISMAEIAEAGFVMVVACTGCEMTMAILSPSAYLDATGCIWCADCAGMPRTEVQE